ncbi:MAG TPA: acyl-CoA dehydrogenase family protein [Noviherbaspirillum sp.]|nr:acyl-CoA dehydrogenase family protein [Noviherbaspirillum sp.]
MDFSFTEEQQMLLDATRRFIAKDYTFETRRRILAESAEGFSRQVWATLADIGLLSLNLPEEDGGMGGGTIENMLAMTAVGEGLMLEPYLASAVLGTRTIAALGTPAQREQWLPALAGGEQIAALAHDEPGTRFARMNVTTRADSDNDGYVLHGHKSVIAHGGHADLLLVSARNGKDDGIAVFCVPRTTPGVRVLAYPTVDGVGAADIWFDGVRLPATARLGESPDASAALEDVLDFGLAAVCAEAVGALDRLMAATVEYTRNRKQFGQPIGKFQALQHRMADMLLHIEQARSISYLAAVRCTDADRAARAKALSAAKVVIGQACRFVGQEAVQLHGGMGMSDELDVSHYFKRLMAIELQFGSTDHHLEQYAQSLG